MNLTEEEKERIRALIRSSEYLREDEGKKIPWMKLVTAGIVVWLILVGTTMLFNNI